MSVTSFAAHASGISNRPKCSCSCCQVSFAHSVLAQGHGPGEAAGRHGRGTALLQGEDLVNALRRGTEKHDEQTAAQQASSEEDSDQDVDQGLTEDDDDATPDNRSCMEEAGADLDELRGESSFRFFSSPSNLR